MFSTYLVPACTILSFTPFGLLLISQVKSIKPTNGTAGDIVTIYGVLGPHHEEYTITIGRA